MFNYVYNLMHGRTGRKKLGGQKEICPTFSECALVVKKFTAETFQNCCRRGGGGGSDYEKFLLDSIFPTKLTEFPTKFVPFIFIISQYCPTVKRILPDWLCLPPGTPMISCFVQLPVWAAGLHRLLQGWLKITFNTIFH